jgi:two-component system response regulator PilR (NtrC family)
MSMQTPVPQQARILVIDDEPDLRTLYELTLLREGYRVEAAGDLSQARQQLSENRFDAVITDMRLPDGLGLELLRDMVNQQRRSAAWSSRRTAPPKTRSRPSRPAPLTTSPSRSTSSSSAAWWLRPCRGEAKRLPPCRHLPPRPNAPSRTPASRPWRWPLPPAAEAPLILKKLVGESAVMRAVKSRIVKVAGSMAPVLIQGESGTGKELVARAVHGCSHRAAGPFVAVNCSAIPENLLEAEFFGARKGAYTGSTQDRQGYFQAAKGGTLFLDEIGDLPLAMQSKLLRAIQERTVRPLGSPQEDAVDVRIVSATHKDLAAEVQAGTFRQDLYYRLNVIEILVPPCASAGKTCPRCARPCWPESARSPASQCPH